MKTLLLIPILFLTACSTVGTFGTHPVEQGVADHIFNEFNTVIRTGSVDPRLGRRTADEFFRIGRSEYWRVRQEQIIEQREQERNQRYGNISY